MYSMSDALGLGSARGMNSSSAILELVIEPAPFDVFIFFEIFPRDKTSLNSNFFKVAEISARSPFLLVFP